jgi:hypothetical protein
MAPIAIDTLTIDDQSPHPVLKPTSEPTAIIAHSKADAVIPGEVRLPPARTLERYRKAGIDISEGYPYFPPNKPQFAQDVEQIRTTRNAYIDPATRADPEKKALFGAAKEVRNLGVHLGVSALELVSVLADRCRRRSSGFSSTSSRTSRKTSSLCS